MSKKLVTQPALVQLTDFNNDVRVTCESISSNGKNTFLKFLIQNQSPVSEFHIGSLQLTLIQNSGNLKKLNPKYIAESAGVLPKKESTIVVVAENQSVIQPNEVFVFEMEDQVKKTKLVINISSNNFLGKGATF